MWTITYQDFQMLRRLALLALAAFLFNAVLRDASAEPGAAPIDESLITATLHVSTGGDDATGNGTPGAPFASISHALNVAQNNYNQHNLGVRVLVQPGTYREGNPGDAWAVLFPSPATPAPVVLEGAGWDPEAPANTGDVIVSGSKVWENWIANGDGTWRKDWPYKWGASPLNGSNPPAVEAFRRYEMIHVDGETYYQIAGPDDTAALAKLTAEEGAFWVDEGTETITIRPPASVSDLNDHLVEVTTQRRLLYHFRPMSETSDTFIVIRNLVFQHAAPGLMESAVHIQNGRNVLVEDCVVRDNKHTGIFMDMRAPYTVRRLLAIRNGEAGASGRGRGGLWEDCNFSYNARQAHISGYYSWTVCGIKLGDAQNTVIRRSRASHNAGFGFWWDTGCFRSALIDSAATHNFASGVFIEFNNNLNPEQPPLGDDTSVLVQNTVLAHNRRPPVGVYMGRGAVLSENENAVFDHVIFYDNDVQFGILENNRGPQGRTIIRHSILAAALENQLLYANAYGTTMWRQFFDTLNGKTNDNDYFHPDDDGKPFSTRDQVIEHTLDQWRNEHLNNPNNLSTDRAVDSRSTFAKTGYTGQPLVSIQTSDAYVANDSGTGFFTVSRASADLSEPLTVHFTVPTGAEYATPGEAYALIGTQVTIPAGAHHALIVIDPVSYELEEAEEIVRIELAASAHYVLGRDAAQFVLVDPNMTLIPNVSVVATSPVAFEQGEIPGVFTLSRTGSPTEPLDVFYTLSGTASPGLDYIEPSGTATFPAGSSHTTVVITPIDDDIPEVDETVIITLTPHETYRVGQPGFPASATITIRDNDAIPSAPIHVEVGADGALAYHLTLHNPSDTAQTFTFTLPSFTDYTISTSHESSGPVYDWQDIAATGTLVSDLTGTNNEWTTHANGQDGEEGMLPFGFNFPFYTEEGGGHFPGGFISGNGIISLGATRPQTQSSSRRPLPNTQAASNMQLPGNVICFFWSNLIFRDADNQPVGSVHIQSEDRSGDGSTDTFIVQFTDVRHMYSRNQGVTAQAILRHTGEMVFQYKNITFSPAVYGSTIGMQDVTPGTPHATQVAFSSDFITDGLAVRISPPARWVAASQHQITVPPESSEDFTLNFNALNLPVGAIRNTQIHLSSDSPSQPPVSLNTQMTVVEPTDTIPPPPETILNLTAGVSGYEHIASTIRSDQPDTNFGTDGLFLVGKVSGANMRSVFSFPLTDIPVDSEIIHVSLDIVATVPGQGTLGELELRALTGTPTRDHVTWNRRDADTDWDTRGGDALTPELSNTPGFNSSETGIARHFPSSLQFIQAAQAAYDLGQPLNLLVLSPQSEAQGADQFARFGTGTYPPTQRPRLRIIHRPVPFSTPTGFQASAASLHAIALSWNNVPNETGYRIERSPNGEDDWILLADLPADTTSYTDTGLEPDTTWFYRILAYNDDGDSDWSSAVQASTLPLEITATFTADVNGYSHVGATIRSGQPDSNFGADHQIIVGLVNGTDRMRGVLSFPITGIPQNSVVTDVSLVLTTAAQGGQHTLGTVELRALSATPVESAVTWNHRTAANPWTTPGGDALTPALSSLAPFDATETLAQRTFESSPAFIEAVQDALDNETPLNLLVLSPDSETQTDNQFARFASDDEPSVEIRPQLRVTYRPLASYSAFEQWLFAGGLPMSADPAAVLHEGGPSLGQAYAFDIPFDEVGSERLPGIDLSVPGEFALTFFRARGELVYEVRASSDLQSWAVIAINPGEVGEQVTVPDPEPMHSQTKRFLGLWVADPP